MLTSPPTSPEAAVRLLQLVVDNMPQFIFWKDRRSVYLGCNEDFARVAGVASPADIVGKTDFDLAWKDEEARFFREVDERVMSSGKAEYHIVEPQMQSDGKEAWLETNKIPLFDADGNVTGILGTYEDITARRAEQEAAQHKKRLESIGKLAGGVAHDFNNLLGGIIGAAELLQRRVSDEAEKELLQEILRTSERAADLTNKLLAFSRRGNMQEDVLNVHEAVENVAPLLRRGLDARINVEFSLAAAHHHVTGDASEIELALLNLGLNARDAMPGGGTLRIATENVQLGDEDCRRSPFNIQPGRYLRIRVEDTGTGIPEDVQERIFEPFFTTKETGSGTGLGLAAVYGAVQAHHGSVRLDSERERGAGFLIDLPLTEASLVGTAEQRAPGTKLERGIVLVVDDEPLLRRTTGERFRKLGYEVRTAESGEVALEIFAEAGEELVLVVMDVVMPGMGGVECTRRMRLARDDLPIILSSGFTREQLIGSEEHTKRVAFLKKPYAYSTLLRAVEDAVSIVGGAASQRGVGA